MRAQLLQSFLFGTKSTTLGVQVLGPSTPYYFGFKGIAPNPEGRVPPGGGNPFDGLHDEKFNPVPFLFAIADHPEGFTHASASAGDEHGQQHKAGTPQTAGNFSPISNTPPGLKGWPTAPPPAEQALVPPVGAIKPPTPSSGPSSSGRSGAAASVSRMPGMAKHSPQKQVEMR